MVPGLEGFSRRAGDIREQLAPVFLRFLLAAELAIHRDVFDVCVNRLLVRVQAAKLERVFVVALQVIIVEERMVIPPRRSISVERVCLFRQCHAAFPLSRACDHAGESGQDLGVIGRKLDRLLGLALEQIELLGEEVG